MASQNTAVLDPAMQVVTAEETLQTLPDAPPRTEFKRDFRFWMIFFCIAACQFITALELAAVSTALPTIVDSLHGQQFIWIGSAYTISTTAFVPFSGNFANVFGRRLTMLSSLIIFAVGSAVCGAAKSMDMLIAARVIQGVGSGGIQAMCQIIISDIIPLKERGLFNGFLALGWCISTGIGPVVGGALAEYGAWRWLFYLNIPICGTVAALVTMFVKVRTPPGGIFEKLAKIDWVGNAIIMAATTSTMIGLTWGGVQYSWGSYHILVPLILGLFGFVAFLVYEGLVPIDPMAPWAILSKRTSLSGFLQTLMNYTVSATMLYYLPVYFQACRDASPVGSGVALLGYVFILAPVAVVTGASISKRHKYRPQMWFGWAITVIAAGALSTVYADTPRGHAIGFEILAGVGCGVLAAALSFPILAPLSVEIHPHALSLYMFFRNLSYILGITIGGAVLQNELTKNLPSGFAQQFSGRTSIAYSIIPLIKNLPQPLKGEVQNAFGNSVRVIWQVLIGISGLGLLCSLLMEGLPLHTATDEKWGLEENSNAAHVELEEQKFKGSNIVLSRDASGSRSHLSLS